MVNSCGLAASRPCIITASRPRIITASRPRSITASQPRDIAASRPRSITASQPRDVAASRPRTITASGRHCPRPTFQGIPFSKPTSLIRALPHKHKAQSPAVLSFSSLQHRTQHSATRAHHNLHLFTRHTLEASFIIVFCQSNPASSVSALLKSGIFLANPCLARSSIL